MNNDDKELLELAAKAAGLQFIEPAEGYDGSLGLMVGEDSMGTVMWNPLKDSGHAFNLAVMLSIHVSPTPAYTEARYFDGAAWQCYRCVGNTRQSARRAIVRAAAAIGRTMP